MSVAPMDEQNGEPSDKLSKWRRRLWPVHYSENKKVFSLLFLKFCVSFNFAILHATKDTLIVTQGFGAETIPILKGSFVLFFAFLFMIVYSKLSDHLSSSQLFYFALCPFLAFFAIYGFFLYPNRELLSPTESADWLISVLGEERGHWVAVYRNWMDSLFFLMAELWGGVVIGLLFWGFANQINTIKEASRFYTILSAGGHVGIIAAGYLIWYFTQSFVNHSYLLTIQYLMGFVTLVNLLMFFTYWLMNRHIAKDGIQVIASKKKNAGLSLKESLLHILFSPNLGWIALMVIGYSLSVNMVEVLWKATLKLKYPNSNDYQAFMGLISSITGWLSLFLSLFAGGNIIRTFGWSGGAKLTPIVLGTASAIFLGTYLSYAYYAESPLAIGASGLTLIVMCGALHNVACKSMKYCLFDPTKEMAYISLDEETKTKGKAAVDVVASRFGKSGSSWIQVGLMECLSVSSVLSIAHFLTPIIILSVLAWLVAVYFLKNRVQTKMGQSALQDSLQTTA
ncbi:Npt1/Npt2 family nucleotide transporter [Parachlamydia sp. AcF125]|uniref:Npt1/Npt2 family nucleotide transporter n=1 Tax=Parachlamydia sp. AcF125 TaxID=2795736 RepID=UPI001BC945C5|nr:Npt1/Npt2 family nucleotide transporter [Parachlamydia sp. AcF125]MBS4168942.1 ADP,ATP carrier protein 1 [Parachlamydia sp. AcF125]